MTPERARRLAGRWFIAALAVLAVHTGLSLVGFDPGGISTGLTTLCLMVSMRHSGWAQGYREGAKAVRR